MSTYEAFRARTVVTSNGCWVVVAIRTGEPLALSSSGYCLVRVDGRQWLAHRYLWEMANGAIPDGLVLDHLCRNPACCNPAHLEPVSQRVNLLRGQTLQAANASKVACPQGHPYAGVNLYVSPRTGRRTCRECHRTHQRTYLSRKVG